MRISLLFLLVFSFNLIAQNTYFVDFDNSSNIDDLFEYHRVWQHSNSISAYDEGSGCIVSSNRDYNEYDLITRTLNLDSNSFLNFDFAGNTYYLNYYSYISIFASTNGGASWTNIHIIPAESLITFKHVSRVIPLKEDWRKRVLPLPEGTNKIKIYTANPDSRIFLDNIKIGNKNIEDISIIKNLTLIGYNNINYNPGIQIKNLGSERQNFDVTFTINEINYKEIINIAELIPGEVRNIFFNNYKPPLGYYTYQFRISTKDDLSNNMREGSFGMFNADWNYGSVFGENNANGACIGYSSNDTDYVFINGGFSTVHGANFYKYNLMNDQFEQLTPVPIHLYSNDFVVKDSFIYMPGGLHHPPYDMPLGNNDHEDKWIPILYRYNIHANEWSSLLDNLPPFTDYSVSLVKDSLLYMIGSNWYWWNDTPHVSYIINLNTLKIEGATNVVQGSRELVNLNDTLYLFYPNYLLQGIIDSIDPKVITWSVYDDYLERYSNVNYWGDNLFILAGVSSFVSGDKYVRDGYNMYLYDLKKKETKLFLPKSTESYSLYSASFIKKDNKKLFTLGNVDFDLDSLRPQILTEYLTGVLPNDIREQQIFISGYELKQNYPNPFNPKTRIEYLIPEPGFVKLKVYNSLGEVVKSLVNDYKDKGNYKLDLDLNSLSSGIYIYSLEVNSIKISKKMMLLK